VLVIAIDATKSAQKHLYYQGQVAGHLGERCLDRGVPVSLVAYASRAVPLAENITSISKIYNIIEFISASKGVPEPVIAVRESVLLLLSRSPGGRAENTIVVFWSMPKKPRIPLEFMVPLAESVGASLKVVGLQYTTPRWMRGRTDVSIDIIYKRNLKPRDLAEKIGC